MANLVTEGQSWKSLPRPRPPLVHRACAATYPAVIGREFPWCRPGASLAAQAVENTYFGVFPTRIGSDSSQNFPYQILMTSRDQDMFRKLPKLKLGVYHQKRRPKLGKYYHSSFKSTFLLDVFPTTKQIGNLQEVSPINKIGRAHV